MVSVIPALGPEGMQHAYASLVCEQRMALVEKGCDSFMNKHPGLFDGKAERIRASPLRVLTSCWSFCVMLLPTGRNRALGVAPPERGAASTTFTTATIRWCTTTLFEAHQHLLVLCHGTPWPGQWHVVALVSNDACVTIWSMNYPDGLHHRT